MSRPGARVAIAIASLAAVVWLVVALVVITDRGSDGGTAETLPPVTSTSTTVPGSAAPSSSEPASTAPATIGSTTAESTTSTVPPPLVIDLAVPAPAMTPSVLATFPIVEPGGSRPAYVVTTDHHKRIVVLDLISADISFADLATGAWTSYPSDIPVSNWSGYFVLGPDDVLYMQMLETPTAPVGVVYALQDGRYVQVVRYPSGIGDSHVVAASTGPAVIGDPTHPLTPYVGADGAPSGATLPDHDFGQVSLAPTQVTLARGSRTWSLQIAHTTCDGMCNSLGLGPGDDALLFSQLGNSSQSRITWLSDKMRSWDTDWQFAGPVDGGLIVTRANGDQFEIGLVK